MTCVLPLRWPLLQHPCLWADNLLSSPATCRPPTSTYSGPHHSSLRHSLCQPCLTPGGQKKSPKNQANLQPAGSTLRLWIKDCRPWAFSVIDVCHIIHRPNKCTLPQPITSLKPAPPRVSAHSFCLSPKHSPAAAFFNTRAPSKKRRHLVRALKAKRRKKELNCSLHGNVPK